MTESNGFDVANANIWLDADPQQGPILRPDQTASEDSDRAKADQLDTQQILDHVTEILADSADEDDTSLAADAASQSGNGAVGAKTDPQQDAANADLAAAPILHQGIGRPDQARLRELIGFRNAEIDEHWTGGDEGLRWLGRLRNLNSLTIQGIDLTERQLKIIAKLPDLDQLQILRCSYQIDDMFDLQSARPEVRVRIIGAALLGVMGSLDANAGCGISTVNDGSAAQEAGIQIGDVITKVNDRPVTEFQQLITVVGSFKPGKVIDIELQRGEKLVRTKATLKVRDLLMDN